MNYFLIANNSKLTEATINKLVLDTNNDVIILFNFLLPLKFVTIKNYTNKICISRKRPVLSRQYSSIYNVSEFYCNMTAIKQNENLFQKIFFLPCPSNIEKDPETYQANIDYFKFNTDKINCIDYNCHTMREQLSYPGTGIRYEVSTGIILLDFLERTKEEQDKIILVGFTSELSEFHISNWEKQYFLNKIEQKKCYAIDSYGITNFI